jgi:hypothetical protein
MILKLFHRQQICSTIFVHCVHWNAGFKRTRDYLNEANEV